MPRPDPSSATHPAKPPPSPEQAPPGAPDFDRLVADYQPRMIRLVGRLLDGSDDTEDVVQDVFVQALEKIGQFRGEASPWTWLAAIAINRCRSRRRRGRLWPGRWLRLVARQQQLEQPDGGESPRLETVRAAVRRLASKYREPVVLRYFEDLSIDDVARILGLSPGAVETRLSRARRKLKLMLNDFDGIR